MNKKVLVIYASAGEGHRKAAEAIFEALKEIYGSGQDITIIDSLDYTNRFFKWVYSTQYIALITHLPRVWGFLFTFFDLRWVYFFARGLRRFVNALNCKRLEEFLCREAPSVIISTHFLPNEVISHLKRKGKLTSRLISAATDFRVHTFWVASGVDLYAVSFEDSKKDLVEKGAHPDIVKILGLPISLKFSRKQDMRFLQTKLGISPEAFTILIVGGGFGVGPVEELVESLGNLSLRIQLLVVCGRNERLLERMINKKEKLKCPIQVYGFVENMEELMGASQLLITKSGGMTTSEGLAMGLPMVVVEPIPGQESRNCRVLVKHGAAIELDRPEEIAGLVKDFINAPKLLARMRGDIKKIAHPNSAREIVGLAMSPHPNPLPFGERERARGKLK